jgi:hypothetical protein
MGFRDMEYRKILKEQQIKEEEGISEQCQFKRKDSSELQSQVYE